MNRTLGLSMIFARSRFPAIAMDESTVYDLLQPESHQFAIQYDTATDRGGVSRPITTSSARVARPVMKRCSIAPPAKNCP